MWRPPDISGFRHLENEMYISSGNMYILTGEMYISSISHQLKYTHTSFHLKYTSHSLSGGRGRHLVSGSRHLENEMYISSGKIFQLVRCIILIWRPPDISGGR